MKNAGTPGPVDGLIGAEAASYWEENPEKIPEGSPYRDDYMQVAKQDEPQGEIDETLFYKTLFVILTGIVIF